jgi:hypothetical protein
MAHPKAQALSTPACLKYAALLLFSYALLLLSFGLRIYEDAAIPPWAAFLKYPHYFEKDLLPQTFTQTPLPERTVAAYLLGF